MPKLIDNAAVTGPAVAVAPGRYCYAVDGTFGGATVALKMLGPDGTNYIGVGDDAALTAEGAVLVDLPACSVRAEISGGSPANIHASLERVGL